jgi:glycine hydroxymethyltransferase
MHIIAGKAVAFKEALDPSFKVYQDQVVKNAQAMAGRLMERGFNLVSGGTDNHLMLIDLTNKNINGRDASNLLESVYVTANKNTVPGEKLSPFVTSGIRLGTPAATARGMKEAQMVLIADIIADIIENPTSEGVKEKSKKTVHEIVSEFPLYA